MPDDGNQSPEDVIREALDRVTAALLTLAMETLRAHASSISGEVPPDTQERVRNVYSKVLSRLYE